VRTTSGWAHDRMLTLLLCVAGMDIPRTVCEVGQQGCWGAWAQLTVLANCLRFLHECMQHYKTLADSDRTQAGISRSWGLWCVIGIICAMLLFEIEWCFVWAEDAMALRVRLPSKPSFVYTTLAGCSIKIPRSRAASQTISPGIRDSASWCQCAVPLH